MSSASRRIRWRRLVCDVIDLLFIVAISAAVQCAEYVNRHAGYMFWLGCLFMLGWMALRYKLREWRDGAP